MTAVSSETDEEWEAIRDETIQELVELGEPEVFTAYQKMWNDAAAVIVPLVQQAQIKNEVDSYTPEEYADRTGAGTEVQDAERTGAGTEVQDAERTRAGTEVQEP